MKLIWNKKTLYHQYLHERDARDCKEKNNSNGLLEYVNTNKT